MGWHPWYGCNVQNCRQEQDLNSHQFCTSKMLISLLQSVKPSVTIDKEETVSDQALGSLTQHLKGPLWAMRGFVSHKGPFQVMRGLFRSVQVYMARSHMCVKTKNEFRLVLNLYFLPIFLHFTYCICLYMNIKIIKSLYISITQCLPSISAHFSYFSPSITLSGGSLSSNPRRVHSLNCTRKCILSNILFSSSVN